MPPQDHSSSTDAVIAAVVITVSDRSSRGERADASGPRAVDLLRGAGFDVEYRLVPDGEHSVRDALQDAIVAGARFIVTSGGTGVGPRDRTPEGTRLVLVQELPGIAEQLRRVGSREHPTAVLSRGLAGIAGHSGRALVVNLPGSMNAVEEGLAVLIPLVRHVIDQLDGGDH